MDWVVMVDSTVSSSEFSRIRQYLDGLANTFYYEQALSNPRLSIVQYAENPQVAWNLGANIDYSVQIANLNQLPGSNPSVSRALREVIDTVLPGSNGMYPAREQVIVLVSDAEQDLRDICDFTSELAGVKVIVLNMADTVLNFDFSCGVGWIQIDTYDSYTDGSFVELAPQTTNEMACSIDDIPFEAYYNLMGNLVNDYNNYESGMGYWLFRTEESWNIVDPDIINDGVSLGTLVTRALPNPNSQRPQDMITWDHLEETGWNRAFHNVRIYCSATPGPTTVPSDMPSVSPSLFPTITCENFHVSATPCSGYANLDAVFILDSSSSIDADEYTVYTYWMAWAANFILPPGSRMGLMQYSTGVQIEFQLDTYDDPNTWQSVIANLDQLGGQTFSANALNFALDNMWAPFIDEFRARMTVFFSDAVPTSQSQSPCPDVYQRYVDAGILLMVIGFVPNGTDTANLDLTPWSCGFPPHQVQVLIQEGFADSQEDVEEIVAFLCPEGTPYDAGYSWTGEYSDNYPVYISADNFYSLYSGAQNRWIFTGNTGDMAMVEETYSTYKTPPNDQTWGYVNETGGVEVYTNVKIICVDTTIPTMFPTVQPSDTPTNAPSDCCSWLPHLIEELIDCYDTLMSLDLFAVDKATRMLLDILQVLFQCEGLFEDCLLSGLDEFGNFTNGTNSTNGTSGSSRTASELCCEWTRILNELIDDCEDLIDDIRNGTYINGTRVIYVNTTCVEQAADLEVLQDRVEILESNVTTLETTMNQCEERWDTTDNILDLIGNSAQSWQSAVDSGTSCTMVPPSVCSDISGCVLDSDTCQTAVVVTGNG